MSKKKHKKKDGNKELTGEKHDKLVGKLLITAPGGAAFALSEMYSQADFMQSFNYIMDSIKAVHDDSLRGAESMLVSQAYVLQALFNTQATYAIKSTYTPEAEMHANIAFRAQSQCNRTLRTLLEYKNPKRATFIKQQINTLNQQINQTEKLEKNVNPANKLLEVNHDARLDTGTPQEGVRGDTTLETMGEVHRAKDA